MRSLKTLIIIGVFLWGTLMTSGNAHAIYSPTIAVRAGLIKQHILAAQAQNGTGTILSTFETIRAQNAAAKNKGEVTGLPGDSTRIRKRILEDLTIDLIKRPFDSLFMVFGFIRGPDGNAEFISNCLRDDIWLLEDLKDMVIQEMVKSYLIYDKFNANILEEDYKWLLEHIAILKENGAHPDKRMTVAIEENGVLKPKQITANQYLFGSDNSINYYVYSLPTEGEERRGCPDETFERAFEQVGRSAKVLAVMASGRNSDWGNIWEMAQARAKRRAGEWIRANQISLTLGGERGGQQESLVKGGGWDKFTGDVKTQWRIVKNMIGPVTPLFSWDIYQTVGGETLIESGSGCVYYYPENQVFMQCTEEQRQKFEVCRGDNAAEKESIRCDRFSPGPDLTTISEKIHQQIIREGKILNDREEVLVAFKLQLNLQNVSEQNLYNVDRALFELNGEVKRSIEAVDDNAGAGLPTISRQLDIFFQKHCPNKPISSRARVR